MFGNTSALAIEGRSLRRLCSARARLLFDEVGDSHEIVGQHGCADQQLEPLLSVCEASPHATPTEEDRDSAFNTGTEALGLLEGWTLFEGRTVRGFLSAALRNAHTADTGLLTAFLVVRIMKATIGSEDLGS